MSRRALPAFETPPPLRGQHDELEVVNPDPSNPGARRVQVKRPDRLAKYLALGSIAGWQHDAGRWLADDWETAGKLPRYTANLLSSGGGRRDMSGAQLDAHRKVLAALGGHRRRFSSLLVGVCCFDEAAGSVPVLGWALALLAVHYGLIKPQDPAFRSLRNRKSGTKRSGTPRNRARVPQLTHRQLRERQREETEMAKGRPAPKPPTKPAPGAKATKGTKTTKLLNKIAKSTFRRRAWRSGCPTRDVGGRKTH